MPTISNRKIILEFSGDISTQLAFDALENQNSPAVLEILTLALGDNTITLPTGGSTVKSAIIIPPIDNIETITLKGDVADVGFVLGKLDPFVLTFDAIPPVSFILTTSEVITGLRIVWA